MPIKDFGKKVNDVFHEAVDTVKTKAEKVEMPDFKKLGDKASEQVQSIFQKKVAETADDVGTAEQLAFSNISARNALKVIYFLMAADGEIYHGEEEKFDAIGKELSPDFASVKESIVKDCQTAMESMIDPEDHYDVIQDCVENALLSSQQAEETVITPKLLVWDLLTVAYSDESYNDTERRLLKYIVRKLNIDKAVFLEMESSILTLLDLEKELAWIKTTNRPYLTIEAMVNEITGRRNTIFESVKDLISL